MTVEEALACLSTKSVLALQVALVLSRRGRLSRHDLGYVFRDVACSTVYRALAELYDMRVVVGDDEGLFVFNHRYEEWSGMMLDRCRVLMGKE